MIARKYNVSLSYVGAIVRNEVRRTEDAERTREEITLLRRNPGYEDEMKQGAAASQARLLEMLTRDAAAGLLPEGAVTGLPPAGEAPEPVAVQHAERCAMTLFPGSSLCTCGAISYGVKKSALEKP
jgi:hypothetical protein